MPVLQTTCHFSPWTVREYPPIPIRGGSGNTNTTIVKDAAYGNGTYVASYSADQGAASGPGYAFDDNVTNQNYIWRGKSGVYDGNSGVYIGTQSTPVEGTLIAGEWLQLELPVPIVLTFFQLTPRDQATDDVFDGIPKHFYVVASNDLNQDWVQLFSYEGTDSWWDNRETKSFTLTPIQPYTYYRYIVHATDRVKNTTNLWHSMTCLNEWDLFGYEAALSYRFPLRIPLDRLQGYGHSVFLKGVAVLGSKSEELVLPNTLRCQFELDSRIQSISNFPLQDMIAFKLKPQAQQLYHHWFPDLHIGNMSDGTNALTVWCVLSHDTLFSKLPTSISLQFEIHQPYI